MDSGWQSRVSGWRARGSTRNTCLSGTPAPGQSLTCRDQPSPGYMFTGMYGNTHVASGVPLANDLTSSRLSFPFCRMGSGQDLAYGVIVRVQG